jgi:hypothetical protein
VDPNREFEGSNFLTRFQEERLLALLDCLLRFLFPLRLSLGLLPPPDLVLYLRLLRSTDLDNQTSI